MYFRDRRLLQPAQVCDILKGILLVICYFMMHYVDYSMMYHLIRGQSVIKLYIIYNMLEVSEGLLHLASRPAGLVGVRTWSPVARNAHLTALVSALLALVHTVAWRPR